MLVIHNAQPPISDADLDAAEAVLGAPLPEDYRRFLLGHNGGQPDERAFDFPNAKPGLAKGDDCDWFLSLSDATPRSLLKIFRRGSDAVPEDLIVFGHSPGGNEFLLSLRADCPGHVFYRDHEIESRTAFADGGVTLPEGMIWLAASFQDFVDRLYDPDL